MAPGLHLLPLMALSARSLPNCDGFGAPAALGGNTMSNQGKFSFWSVPLSALLWVDAPAFTPAWQGSIISTACTSRLPWLNVSKNLVPNANLQDLIQKLEQWPQQ